MTHFSSPNFDVAENLFEIKKMMHIKHNTLNISNFKFSQAAIENS